MLAFSCDLARRLSVDQIDVGGVSELIELMIWRRPSKRLGLLSKMRLMLSDSV